MHTNKKTVQFGQHKKVKKKWRIPGSVNGEGTGTGSGRGAGVGSMRARCRFEM